MTQDVKFYQTGTFTIGNRLLDPDQRAVQASTARDNSLTSGHRACQGCGEALGARYAVDVLVHAQESVDLMKDITDILAREKILISGLRTARQGGTDSRCQLSFSLEVEDTAQLQKAMSALMQVAGVAQVERV